MHLPDAPANAKKHFAPVVLPSIAEQEGLTGSAAQRYWGKDRAALALCGATLDGFVGGYEDLQRSLSAADKH